MKTEKKKSTSSSLLDSMFSNLNKNFALLTIQPVSRSATVASDSSMQQVYPVSYMQTPVLYMQKPSVHGSVSLPSLLLHE